MSESNESEPVRKAQFESDDTEAAGRLNVAGHFAVEKDADEESTDEDGDADATDPDEVSKAVGGLDVSNPSGVFGSRASEAVEKSADVDAGDASEWAGRDLDLTGGGPTTEERVEKTAEETPEGLDVMDQQGLFETEQSILKDIRELLDRDDLPGDIEERVNKAMADAEEGDADDGAEDDLADDYAAMLDASEAVLEDAEALVEGDAEGEEWADLEGRVDGLIERMRAAPEPSTPAEVAAVETLKERAATVADLLDPDEDGAGDEEADGDADGGADGDEGETGADEEEVDAGGGDD